MRQEWNLLHLSDLHFGELTNANDSLFFDDNKESVPSSVRDSVIRRFYHVLDNAGEVLKVDAVAVTGDITTRGSQDGFQVFSDKTAPRLQKLVASPRSVCIVPGNHDVAWNLRKSDTALFDVKFEGFKNMAQKIGASTCLLPTGTLSDDADSGIDFLEVDKDDSTPIYLDEKKKLLILCINSAIRCGEVNECRRSRMEEPLEESIGKLEEIILGLNHGSSDLKVKLQHLKVTLGDLKERAAMQTIFDVAHVTESQMTRLSSKLTYLQGLYSKEWDSFLRVAIMHHHLLPFTGQATEHKTYDLITDAAGVRDFLADSRFHIVLTGHKHQPYGEIHVGRNGKKLLVAGGPTVGGMPVRGCTQGFRQIKVISENGRLSARVAEIRLDIPTRNQPQAEITKSIDRATEYLLEESLSSRFCLIPSQAPLTYDATEDRSNESLMFINVVSCREAREQVGLFLQKQIRKGEVDSLNYVGLYDLYGHYDLLVRIDDPSLAGEKGVQLLSQIEEDLRRHNLVHKQGAESTTINLLDAQPFSGERAIHKHTLFPSQKQYEDLRSHRAFILVTKMGHWRPDEIGSVKAMVHRFYLDNRDKLSDTNDWTLSWGRRDIVIEVLVRCGQYYNLQKLTRMLEDLVDQGDRQKMTHIVYHHEEYCPLTAGAMAESISMPESTSRTKETNVRLAGS